MKRLPPVFLITKVTNKKELGNLLCSWARAGILNSLCQSVMKACWEGCFYLIQGSVEHPRTARPVSQTKHYLVQNVSRAEPENYSPISVLFVYRTQRWSMAQAWRTVSLLGLHFAFSPSPQVNGKKTAFMTQRAAGKGNKMIVVSDTNNHKWLCLSCFFFRVREGLDWPVIIIKWLFHPVSISSIHSGHSQSLGLQQQ